LAQEKGASSWLIALPVQEHGFSLHKTAFVMHSLCDMVGYLLVHHLIVLAEPAFQWIMPCHAQRADFQLSVIMK